MTRFSPLNSLLVRILAVIALFAMLVFPATPGLAQTQSTLKVIIHSAQGTPVKGQIAYQVTTYLSVYDKDGNPIKDLSMSNFALTEDAQEVKIDSVEVVKDQPINIILLLDTSGSMTGSPIQSARDAASKFVAGLGPDDLIAVRSFNLTSSVVIDFTKDHAAAQTAIGKVDAVKNTGTCLYDATYEAIQAVAATSGGRQAVIVLTDGVDQLTGTTKCSIHTIDDVIKLSSDQTPNIPIYTLGLGKQIDQNSLQRMAAMTGGSFLFSPDSSKLSAMFTQLLDQLKYEYLIKYQSTAAPGAHTLVVEANYQGNKDQDSRKFLLPELPPVINIVSPAEGEEVSGKIKISVAINGQAEQVAKVVFQIADKEVGADVSAPFVYEGALDASLSGTVKITVIALGRDAAELSRSSVNVKVVAPTAVPSATRLPPTPTVLPPAPTATLSPTPTEKPPLAGGISGSNLYVILGIAGCSIVIIAAIIAILLIVRSVRRKKQEDQYPRDRVPREPAFQAAPGLKTVPEPTPTVQFSAQEMAKTMDKVTMPPKPEVFGTLTILYSDDLAIIGQVLNLIKPVTTVGRSASNDIVLPTDTPVSRIHAKIERVGEEVLLSEVTTQSDGGSIKRPTYGTFVNNLKLEDRPVSLKTGDEIRLGTRLKLRFRRTGALEPSSSDKTFDGFSPPHP